MSDNINKTSGFGIGEAGKSPASTLLDEIEAAKLRRLPTPDYPNGRMLDCGCKVYYKSHTMSANLGTSCANCYDRMSD